LITAQEVTGLNPVEVTIKPILSSDFESVGFFVCRIFAEKLVIYMRLTICTIAKSLDKIATLF
tara:strand:+ start:49306 stop:49494 length:189 start_codon:yes stop_codon:yes gene_type:complete